MDKATEMAVFIRVVDSGGFSAAARELGMSPSAVSKLIGRLENRLDARLLNRTTRQVSLTEEGRAFYDRASRIIADIDEAEGAVRALHAAPRGLLRVNAPVTFGNYQIAPILPSFLDRYPELRVEITLTDALIDLVEEAADVAIRIGRLTDTALVARKLADDRRVICAAPAYLERHGTPRTPDALRRHNCLMSSQPRFLNDWPFDSAQGPQMMTVTGNLESNSGDIRYRMALDGYGIVRMPEFMVGQDLKAGRLVTLLTDCHRTEPVPIHAVYPHRRHLSPKVRAFVDYLVGRFTPTPPWAT